MERKKMNGYGKKILYMVIALAMMIIMLPSKSLAAGNNSSYTVEFTYGEKQYVMNGDSTIHLSNILDYIGLSGEVSSVNVSDSSLFSASRINGEWTVTSHQAFHTEEWMKVTIGGVVYEIVVTDVDYFDTNIPSGVTLTDGGKLNILYYDGDTCLGQSVMNATREDHNNGDYHGYYFSSTGIQNTFNASAIHTSNGYNYGNIVNYFKANSSYQSVGTMSFYDSEYYGSFQYNNTSNSYLVMKINVSKPTYTVTYDTNAGSDTVTGLSSATATVNQGSSTTLPTLSRTGYTFTGWYTSTSGGNKAGNGGASYTPTGNITLHAQWTLTPATAPTISSVSGATLVYGYSANSGSISVTASAASGHTITGYQWYDRGTTNSNSGGTAISGATSASYNIPTGKSTGTYYYYCVVSTKRDDNNQTTTKTSGVATVTINRASITPSITMSGWTYGGTASNPSVSGNSGNGTVTYTYQVNKTGDWTSTKPTTAGTHTVKASIAQTTNYNSATVTKDFTISKAANPLSFQSTQSVSKTYSKSDQTQTLTAATGNQGDLSYAINSQKDSSNSDVTYFSLSGTILTVAANTPAGTYTVVVRATATGNDNYNSGTKDSTVTVTINPKDVTVSGIAAGNKVYDRSTSATLNTSGASFNGLISGDTLTVSATGTFDNMNVGTGKTVTISGLTLGGSSAGNYQLADSGQQASTTADITAKPLTVTAETKTKIYGTDDPALTYTYDGLISGDSFTGTLTREAGSDVGTYAITQGTLTAGDNYAITYTGANLTITQATPVITGISANNLTYNKTEQALVTEGSTTGGTLKYAMTAKNDEAPADDVYTDSVPIAMHAGTYTVYYKVIGNHNYFDVDPASVDVTIAQKEITISGITAADKTYDKTTHATLIYSGINWETCGMVEGDTLTISATGTFSDINAAEGKTVTISNLELGGETISEYKLAATGQQTSTTAAIEKKVVGLEWHIGETIYAENETPTFTYNGIAQAPTAVATEVVEGDTCTVTVTGEEINAGSYTAEASALSNANYALPADTTKPFIINPINIKTNENVSFDVGGTDGHYTYNGTVIKPSIKVLADLESGEGTVLVKDTDYLLSNATSGMETGRYIVKIDGTGNYTGTVYKLWYIDKKTITVQAENKSKTYGDNDPMLTVTVDGASAENVNYSVSREQGENVGEYVITVTGNEEQDDYIVEFINGSFTINKADVTVTADNKKKSYGDVDPELTATVTGLKRGDTEDVIFYTLSRAEGEDIGNYIITPSVEAEQGNYSVSYETGTLTIGKRKLSSDFVRLKVVSFKYDGYNKTPEIVFDGFNVTKDVDYTLSGEQTANDEGMHSITITGKGDNFTGSVTLKWFITGVGDEKVTYDGQPHSISVKDGTEVTYKQSDGSYTDDKPYFTDAGRYTVEYKTIVDNPLYEYFPDEEEPSIEVKAESVLTIEPKAVTITAENTNKIRGEADPTFTWNVDGLIAPDTSDILTVSIGRVSDDNDNVGEHAIIPSGDAVQGNYVVTYVNGILTISAKSADGEDITAVQSEEETLTYTGSSLKPTIIIKDGDDILTEDTDGEGEQPGDYTITYEGVAPTVYDNSPTPPTNAGTYKAVITFKDNYEGTREIEYSVAKAVPTITTNPTPAEITYGNTLADSNLTEGGGSVDGTFAWEDSTIKPSVSDSNATEYTVVFTPEDSVNYESTTVVVTIKVNKATTDKSTLIDDNKPSAVLDIQYNNEEQELITAPEELPDGFTKVQYRLSDTNEWSDDIPTGKDVGDYTVQVKYIGDGNHNDLVADPISVSISKKAVTVKADDISKNYGDADPELTATVTGTLGNDTVIYTVSRAAGEAIGTYTITPSGVAEQGNYVVTYETGVFEVLGKSADSESITVAQVENETLVYDGTTNKPTITVKDGETVLDEDTDGDGVDDGVYSITYEGVEPTVYPESGGDATLPPTNAGTYEAVIVFKTPYTGTRRVVFEIGKKALTITADAKSKTYGEADPALTYTVSGLVTGDTEESVVTGALSRAEGQNAGTYAITKGTLSAGDNYDISYAEANLTIGKKTLAVTADDMTKTYGDADPAFTYTADGFAYEDSIATVMSGALSRAEGSDVGTYAITQGTLSAGDNYDISYTGATLTVTKRNVTLTSVTASKAYDGTALTNAEITVSGDGFADGEGAEYNVTGTQTLPGNSVNGFTYTLKTGTNADNYTITKSEGTLTVTGRTDEGTDKKYEINVEANSSEVTYDGTEHTVNGLVTDEFTFNGVTYTVSGLSATASGTDAGDYVLQVTGTAVVKDQADNVLTNQFIVNTTDGTLKINKRNVTLTSATDSKVYDGTALTNDEIVVSGDGFVAGSETVAAEGATYSVTGSQKLVGSSANSFTYTLNTGTKADNYNITTVAGTLTVTSRDAKYEISPQANSGEVKYDGKEHQVSGFVTDTFVVEGNTYKVSGLTASVKGTDAGTYTVSVSGTAVVKDSDGVDVSDEFSVTPQTGTLTITKRSVTMTSATDSKEYDGDALTNDTVNVSGDRFVTGEGAEYTVTGTRTVTGTSENGFTYTLNTNTKADNYDITTSYGTLTVTNRNTKYNVTLKADSNTEKYDGTAKTVTTYTIDGKAGDTFTASNGKTYTISGMKAEATGTDAGTYTVNVTGTPTIKDSANEDVTAQFAVSVESGTLTINKRSVTLTSDTASKAYDGKALKAEKVTVSGDGFVEGESASYTFTGSQTLPGESDNTFTYALVGAKTDNYNITTVNGKLTVNERNGEGDDSKYKITVKAKSGTFTYDGNVHTVTGFETLEFTVGGVTYTVSGISATGSLTDAGETEVVITGTPKVKDADGNDLTGNFDVECENGKLTVVKATQEKPEDLSFRKASSDTSKDGVITGLDEKRLYEYSEDDGTTWTKVKEGSTEVTGIGAGDVIIRYQENNNKMPSDTIKIVIETKEDQAAPSKDKLVITNASGEDQTDGVITGVDDTMEYSLDAGKNWIPVEEDQTEIDNLPVGDVEIRRKGDEDKNPGEALKISIGVTSRTQGVVNFKTDDSTAPVETSVESAQSSNIEEYAQTQIEEGKDVKIELEITPRKEEDVADTSVTEIAKVSSEVFSAIEAEDVETEYLEIDLAKYVDNTKEGNISDTGTPLEIELNYDASKIGTPVVIRTHKGKAKVFEKLSKKPNDKFVDATYYVDNGKIYLYSQFFSDFALVYATKKTYYVSIDTGVGDPIVQVVGEDSKIELPTGLTKEGYGFGGWYKDADYKSAWDSNKDKVNEDTRIYGKWDKSVTGVSVAADTVNLTMTGEMSQIKVTVSPSDAANKKVIYQSSNTNVATVDENGNITAVGNGTATITVTTEDGTKTATVEVTVTIPEISQQGTDDTVTPEQVEKNSLAMNEGLKIDQKGSKINIRWGRVEDADGYEVYVAYCGTNFNKKKPAKTIKNNKTVSATITKINGKKLNLKKNYKLYVIAYKLVDGKKLIQAKSITGHIVGRKNVAYTNVKAIKLTKTKYTIKVGKTAKIKAKTVLVDKTKKQLSDAHAKEFRYASSNKKIATVDKNGKIKGVKAGTTTIYVYARNGYAKKIKVTVK